MHSKQTFAQLFVGCTNCRWFVSCSTVAKDVKLVVAPKLRIAGQNYTLPFFLAQRTAGPLCNSYYSQLSNFSPTQVNTETIQGALFRQGRGGFIYFVRLLQR